MSTVIYPRRTISTLIGLTALAVLPGCHQATYEQKMDAWVDSGGKSMPTFLTSEEIKRLEERRYIRVLRATLAGDAFNANPEGLRGTVKLTMKLDRQGDVVLCEAESTNAGTPSNLLNLVADVCWSSVWEPVPESLRSPNDGSLEINMSLIVSGETPSIHDHQRVRQRAAVASRFFWDNVVGKQSVNAFGRARFDFTANAKGEVTRCDVELGEHSLRPGLFQPNPELQQALTQRCLQLNVARMPGFQVKADGTAKRVVWVNYLPWKHHVGQY
ncbi:hypothetical protein J3P88_13510 [Pseudomonas sp. Z3-6]|uniref:hypothetical protein n=1 Tax=Pseudomonas sp. Z3-6 TaxID=2817411 RepID=UPI003DA9DD74